MVDSYKVLEIIPIQLFGCKNIILLSLEVKFSIGSIFLFGSYIRDLRGE